MGDSSEWIQALNNIATDYRRMGMLDVAQSYHYQALSLCDESSDTTYQMRKNRVKALNGLGNIYLSIYSYDDADSVFRQALEGEHQLGSATGQAINYEQSDRMMTDLKDLWHALDYYRQSMFYNKKDSNLLGMALCHLYFGNIYERRQQYDLALREYEQSDRMMTDLKDLWHALEPRLSIITPTRTPRHRRCSTGPTPRLAKSTRGSISSRYTISTSSSCSARAATTRRSTTISSPPPIRTASWTTRSWTAYTISASTSSARDSRRW